MTLREILWGAVDGLPDDASVTLPVAWLRERLEEAEAETEARGQKLWTVSELAARFDRAESTIRGWLNAGDFDGAFKAHGSWRVPTDALQKFESAEEESGPALGSGREVDLGRWREQKTP